MSALWRSDPDGLGLVAFLEPVQGVQVVLCHADVTGRISEGLFSFQ